MSSYANWSPSVVGTLKGYDQLMNLVLDDVKETMRGTFPAFRLVCRVSLDETDRMMLITL